MSEYQYYEFLAVDRPLTDQQRQAVRGYSTRAQITSTRFVNEYHWGDFKGRPDDFLKRFFDAFVYIANWGTHRFAFRVPAGAVDLNAAKAYASEAILGIKSAGEVVMFDFSSHDEEGEWEEGGDGWMASLVPVREEILSGDFRSLYIAWLAAVRTEDFDEDEPEPPLPAGMRELSAAQRALAEFIRLDEDLLAAAAEVSPKASAQEDGLAEWIAALPEAEKNDLLTRMCDGRDPHGIVALRRRFQASRVGKVVSQTQPRRSVGQLLAAARELTEKRERREAERCAREKARREAEAVKARADYLARLAPRQAAVWKEVDELIVTKQPGNYDKAVGLLLDLRDLAAQEGATAKYAHRLADLYAQHARKPSLIQKLIKAGLTAP